MNSQYLDTNKYVIMGIQFEKLNRSYRKHNPNINVNMNQCLNDMTRWLVHQLAEIALAISPSSLYK